MSQLMYPSGGSKVSLRKFENRKEDESAHTASAKDQPGYRIEEGGLTIGDVLRSNDRIIRPMQFAINDSRFREGLSNVIYRPTHALLPPRELLRRQRCRETPLRLVVLHSKQRLFESISLALRIAREDERYPTSHYVVQPSR